MSHSTLTLTESLKDYILAHSLRETPVLEQLREQTSRHPASSMQIAPEEGQLLRLLVKLLRPKKVLEIGTFTGYSAICIAMELEEDARLVCLDINTEYTKIARDYWQKAGLTGTIELILGPTLESLERLVRSDQTSTFEMVFIDADKKQYEDYYEAALKLLRPGGLMAIDNVLWGGSVVDPETGDPNTPHIKALNEKIQNDNRVFQSLLPISDGLTLAIKL